jgi:hypothetical protein
LSVGGAEASQKGFGDVMPAIVQRRSAMFGSLGMLFYREVGCGLLCFLKAS